MPSQRPSLPMRNGVGASVMTLPLLFPLSPMLSLPLHPIQPTLPSSNIIQEKGGSPAYPLHSLLLYLEQHAPIPADQSWHQRMQQALVFDAAGQPLAVDAPYLAGQQIYYYRHVQAEPRVPFDEQIVYQDAHLLVADKPHFLPVSPTGRYVQETLLVRLKNRTGLVDLVPIHRIDRDTAGLVLFSVQPASRDAYAALFRNRAVAKIYEAIAHHRPELQFPRIHKSRMVPAASFMQMQEVAGPPNTETQIELLEQRGPLARYRLRPQTGKRHQLRVHMLGLGLPICGDAIYPVLTPEPDLQALDYSRPLQLLAKSLQFTDPATGLQHALESARSLDF